MLQNFKIGTRLGFGFGLMLLLIIVVGLTGYRGVSQSTRATITMLQGDATISEMSSRARANILAQRRYEKDIFLNIGNKAKVEEYNTKWKEQHEHLGARIADLEKNTHLNEKEKAMITAMKAEEASYEKGFAKVYALIAAGKITTPAEANAAMEEFKKEIHEMENKAKELAEETNKIMDEEEKHMTDLARSIAMIVGGAIVIGMVLCLIISIVTTRSITKPLAAAVIIADKLAGGDLTAKADITSRDEVGQLLTAMNTMVDSLRAMLGKVRETSTQVASAAGEISAGSTQLTRAAHSQASAAEETSSTMVQMAASIQSVAGNADSLASNVDEVSASVSQLGASSEQVAKSSEIMASSVSETSATIEQMTVSIDRVAASTDELASSVTETSSTIEQMTVSIEQVAENSQELQKVVAETASTVEEMAVSIRQVAKNVADADAVAKAASKEGAAGQQAVQQALEAMKRVAGVIEKTADSIVNLGKRSEEIGNIVKVINEIADQTNLLALNAAIEAARAGDAGRGFAVVADEVRKLAERSVAATKEIGQVITKVQADTNDSVRFGELASREAQASMDLSEVAGNALTNIVKSIEQTSTLMTQISAMTGEQATASNRVIGAVDKMNKTTSQVASAAREQAMGGRQIRIAVEKMSNISQEVNNATREQSAGSRQIRIAVENMNNVSRQVNVATKEQALSAQQIVMAVNSMNSMTQSVATATSEQKKGGEMVVTAMENISDATRQNLSSVEQLAKSAQNLSQQAVDLEKLVGQFRMI